MAGDARAVRVIAVRRGRFRAAEFALRSGEQGLSLFVCRTDGEVQMVIDAVRAAGKTGELAAAALTGQDVDALGLELVPTPGATPDDRVNHLHVEARLSVATAALARRLGQEPWEFFNQQIAGEIVARAVLVRSGGAA